MSSEQSASNGTKERIVNLHCAHWIPVDISKPTENAIICNYRHDITDFTTTQSATHPLNIYLKCN